MNSAAMWAGPTYTKPKPIPNPIPNPNPNPNPNPTVSNDSNESESDDCVAVFVVVFLMVCWITFLIWGFIYLLTRDVKETDDDNPIPMHHRMLHGRLRM